MSMQTVADALRGRHFGSLDLPYAAFLGLRFERDDDETRLIMPYAEHLIGAPGRLHGGTVAGLLELAGIAAAILSLPDDEPLPRLRPVTVTVDFMREGLPRDVTAVATITRLGRRIINIRSLAWQYERARPIAGANINVLVDRPPAPAAPRPADR